MNRIFKITFICIIYLGNILNVSSQNYVDLFNVGSNISPNNSIKNSNETINISETFCMFKLPIVLKNKDIIIAGTSFNLMSFNKQITLTNSTDFYSTTFQLGYTKQWNDKWNTMLIALPKVSSDFEEVNNKDWQMGGILLFTYKKKENLKYKFGGYYNQEYFGPMFVPIIGIDWQPSDKISVFGNLPIALTFDYRFSKRFSTGIYFNAPTFSYRLGEKFHNEYIQKSSQDLSLYLDSYIFKNIVFSAKGGHSFGRSYRIYSENDKLSAKISAVAIGDNRLQLSNDINDGYFFEIKLSYRVPLKK
ncbi:MAG: DUF6268 family outer membrane beta-barrel protein [Bacteroidota bacterium]